MFLDIRILYNFRGSDCERVKCRFGGEGVERIMFCDICVI